MPRTTACNKSGSCGGVRTVALVVAALFVLAAGLCLAPGRAAAQGVGNLLHFPKHSEPPKQPATPSDAPMLVQADEMRYDYTNNTVSAVGNVQIYYGGSTVEADEVTYDQKTKRLRAQGNVRLTEPTGKITYAQSLDLSDDYRDGFVNSLRLETIDDTRFAASRADRDKGIYTVMQNGVYTACEPCKDDPKKPPLWQVQAKRIIRDENEKMIYFEDARVEFFGLPLMYFPFMSAPDPTVKRKSGFLFPNITDSTAYGFGIQVPYYWALAPSYDLTFSPMFTTSQGVLLQANWRQRLETGSYSITVAGIDQLDPGYFAARDGAGSPTANAFRGVAETAGQFALSDKWVWGWTGLLMTDTQFLFDYQLSQLIGNFDPFHTGFAAEGVSQVYLTGGGDRSYFDMRSMYFYGFSELDIQKQIPVIAPVIDYSNVLPQQVMGGELSYKTNITSLTRQEAEFDAITQNANTQSLCTSGNSAVLNPSNCILRGVAGTYTRASAEVDWRRTFVTANGQMITPFLSARVDAASVDVLNQAGSVELHRHRHERSGPRHAGGRRRIPLSVHRRATLGHPDDPADRATDFAPERDADRQFPQRRRAKRRFQYRQFVLDGQVFGLGPRRGRRPPQRRLPVHRPVQQGGHPRRHVRAILSAVRPQLLRGSRSEQHRSRKRPRQADFGLRGEPDVSAQPNLCFHRQRSLRRGDLHAATSRTGKPRQFRSLDAAIALWRLRRTTGNRLPDAARGAVGGSAVQGHAKLDIARLYPL